MTRGDFGGDSVGGFSDLSEKAMLDRSRRLQSNYMEMTGSFFLFTSAVGSGTMLGFAAYSLANRTQPNAPYRVEYDKKTLS